MSSPVMTEIPIPAELRASSGVASFSCGEDGSGVLVGTDGTEFGKFEIKTSKNGTSTFHFNPRHGRTFNVPFTATKNGDGGVTVSGNLDGQAFSVTVTGDQKLGAGAAPPKLDQGEARVFSAMSRAVIARKAVAQPEDFDRVGCSLAGIGVIVGAFTLDPIGVFLGFAGILASC